MYDVIVIGSGPAGLICARELFLSGFRVLILEKNDVVGKKLSITGGGRSNLFNYKEKSELVEKIHNGEFLRYGFVKYNSDFFWNYFSSVGLKKEERDRVFPISNKSKDVIDFLRDNVEIELNSNVASIEKNESFSVFTEKEKYQSKYVVIATGGLSYPQLGSDGAGYDFAKSFGHSIVNTYPALSPLKTEKHDLAGITVEGGVFSCDKKTFGSILFTHDGLSGPAVYDISAYVGDFVFIDFLVDMDEKLFLEKVTRYSQKKMISSFMKEFIPNRIVDEVFLRNKIFDKKIAEISKKDRAFLFESFKSFKLMVKSKDIDRSIVTGGGICLDEICADTMESRKVDNLYFVGEILDLHGPTGGYNIMISLLTGILASKSIEKKSKLC